MSISGININNCRLCGSTDLTSVMDFGNVPLGNNLHFLIQDAYKSKKYPLVLNNCKSCCHYQLSYSVDKKILYQTDYSYLSSIGKKFVDHLEWSCLDILNLEKNDDLKNKIIVDIGSNDGTALSFFKKKGLKVLGIDPSNLPVQKAKEIGVETINDFFSFSLSKDLVESRGHADIIISHNVLAHVEDLNDIFLGIYHLLKQNGIFVFEIGYFAKMIEEGIYDTIYHEHLDYHSFNPILKFLNKIGFSVFNAKIEDSQGGSLRIYCKKSSKIKNNITKLNYLFEFEKKILEKKQIINWKNTIYKNAKKINLVLQGIKRQGGNIYGYGAPTKASLSCKIINIKKNEVALILEDNPLKVGRHLPYLGVPIVSNTSKNICKEDIIICFAWNFIEAIIIKIRENYGKNIKIISSTTGEIFIT